MAPLRRVRHAWVAVVFLALAGCAADRPADPEVAASTRDNEEQRTVDPARGGRLATPGADLTVHAGRTEDLSVEVAGAKLHVAVQWPADGHVTVALVPPGGPPLSPRSPGVSHERGATFENYHVAEPQTGMWSVMLTGAGDSTEGVPVRVSVHQDGSPDRPPTPVIRQRVNGATVSLAVEAGPDEVSAYLWEFGDGGVSRAGPQVSHTYRESGNFRVSVAVQMGGRWRVATAHEPVEVP